MPKPIILSVDDTDINRYLRAQALTAAGFEVLEAKRGTEAIEIARRERPDLMLLDVHLPDVSGPEICRQIKTDPRTRRIMVLQISASAIEIADAVRGLEGGADGYLVEPVEPELLVAHVRSLMRLRSYETALFESEERLSLALNAAKMGTWDWNVERDEITLGGAHPHLFGAQSAEVAGTFAQFLSFVHPEDRSRFSQEIRATVETRSDCTIQFRIETADARVRWMEFSGRLIGENGGIPSRFMGVMTDITERKEAQIALQQANTDLKHFTFATSHDLQAPIRTVRLFSQLLLRDLDLGDKPEAKQHLELIETTAGAMQALVTDLLSYSQAGRTPETPRSPVALNDALAKALRSLEGSIQESGAEVWSEPLPVALAWVDQIAQVFQNLISNAITYRKVDAVPRVRITAAVSGTRCIVHVSDNGKGFEPLYAERIFEAFTRLGSEAGGTGLGLAICRRIVECHGGRIWAQSTPGQGSTFSFELPAIDAQLTQTAASGYQTAPVSW